MVTTIYWSDPNATLHVGDASDVLAAMPDGSADCIVTSPPYWAKRDYGVAGQYGAKPDPAGYVATLRAIFAQARRVLADDGTCWLNLGDSYSAGSATPNGMHAYIGPGLVGRQAAGLARQEPARPALAGRARPAGRRVDHPQRHRLAQAQRHARVRPRPAQLPVRTDLPARQIPPLLVRPRPHPHPARHRPGQPAPDAASRPRHPGTRPLQRPAPGTSRPRQQKYGPHTRQVTGARRYGTSRSSRRHPNGRNPGDVWSIPTRPYRGPHFAAYPIDIPTRCIQAGCKPGGMVLDPFCGTGTTGLAALTLGRRFTGIDLNPAFADLAAERLRQAAARAVRQRHDRHDRHRERQRVQRHAAAAMPCRGANALLAPPKTRPAAYAHRPGAAPGRPPDDRTAHSRRPIQVRAAGRAARLTPAAARALLRVLLKAHAQLAQEGTQMKDLATLDHQDKP